MTTPEEIEKLMEEKLWEKYTGAIQRLLEDGMPLEELQTRMTRYQHLDLNHQANIMNTMAKYRRTGDLVPLEKIRLTN